MNTAPRPLPDVLFFERLLDEAPALDLVDAQEIVRALSDGLEAFKDGFALFDAQDRLVFCNRAYIPLEVARAFHKPGVTFQEILERELALGVVDVPEDEHAAWLAQRMARFRSPSGVIEQKYKDGRFIHVLERRTRSGGTVTVLSDVRRSNSSRPSSLPPSNACCRSAKTFICAHSMPCARP